MLALHSSFGLLPQDLLEQNAFVRHVLIDDPKPVAGGGDDEAVVNLAERAQVREDRKALRSIQDSLHSGRQRAMRVWHSLRSNALEIKTGFRRCAVFQMEYRQILNTLRRRWNIRHQFELLILDALREVRIWHSRRSLRLRGYRETGSGTRGDQPLADRIANEIMSEAAMPETHFSLGRMYV